MRRPSIKSAATLVELLVCVIVLAAFVLILNLVDIFSHTHVITSDRRAKIQNELSYILEHQTKQISRAIGNTKINRVMVDGDDIINITTITDDVASVSAYIDGGDGIRGTSGDRWISYRIRSSSAPASERYQVWYCSDCGSSPCTTLCSSTWEVLGRRVTDDDTTITFSGSNDYVDIGLSACWDIWNTTNPAIGECGASNRNPAVVMRTRIKMPAVSTN